MEEDARVAGQITDGSGRQVRIRDEGGRDRVVVARQRGQGAMVMAYTDWTGLGKDWRGKV
jgi:hypothetical protein